MIRRQTVSTFNQIYERLLRSSDQLGLPRLVALEINFALWIMIGCAAIKFLN
jgi:hypothetical protein